MHQAITEGLLAPTAAQEILGRLTIPETEIDQDAVAELAAEAAELYCCDSELSDWAEMRAGSIYEYPEEYLDPPEPGVEGGPGSHRRM